MGLAFTSPRCQLHAPPRFPERPARLDAVLEGVGSAGWEVRECTDHPDAREAVLALHSQSYVDRFERAAARGDGLLDSADNPMDGGTWEASWTAVSCALAAADWVMEATGRRALAAVRPPGHHAERDMAMGFCFFGNAAIAADHLVRRRGCERVAIFDFDVHHGNGTQHLLEERSDVLFASVHQYPFYPGTGAAAERGRGAGDGCTVNVPLPAGTGDERLREAVEGEILPALRRFEPQVLLVSAGYDGWVEDPLGGWNLTDAAYGWLGRRLATLADEHCDGRLLSLLEGGYSLEGMRRLTESYLRAQGADR
jgi:acetoin utilization deacetylase AcuC-like enzyme